MGGYQYHVFLSHSSADKPAVEELALWLVRKGVTPFLDKWDLVPGEDWTDALPAALSTSATCAVIIGPGDKGGWQTEEVKQSLIRRVRERNRQAGDRFRIIPVLLPGASAPGADEPSAFDFLAEYTWVKFEKSLDEEHPRHRLVCGIRGVRPGSIDRTIVTGECPYRGLDIFDIAHARLFFGREKLTRDLVGMLGTILRGPGPRLLAVVGPSGSGKSSIVRAGLIPVLEQGAIEGSEGWKRLIFKPGQDPFENLGIALATLPDGAGLLAGTRDVLNIARFGLDHDRSLHTAARLVTRNGMPLGRLLVVVDQFEEVFTQCRSEEDRQKLISNLIEAATLPDGPVVVVLSLRADFLGRCASYRALADAISCRQKLIGEMVEDELRWAIEKPAALAGGEIETGLVEQLLQDVGSEPGSLPLLEFALSELWRQKTGRRMTIEDYHEIGGLRGALKRHAETVLDGLKRRGLEEVCRRIFLDLIEPGKGAVDTRRRVHYRQLAVSADWTAVVETLVHERLVTTDKPDDLKEGTAEIVHESLIKYWPTLQDWVNKSRERMEFRSELEDAAIRWIKYHRDSDSLLRGLPLANALEWARTDPDDLVRLASVEEFLDCSKAAELRREQDELKQERHLREEAEAAVIYQKKLSRGSLITTAAVLILVALAAWIELSSLRLEDEKRSRERRAVSDAQQAMFKADWHGVKHHLTIALTSIDRESAPADDYARIYLMRGVSHSKLREFDAAEADFQKASESRDEEARYALFVNRAEHWLRRGRGDDAAADLKKAIDLKPDRFQAHVNLALLSKEDLRYEEAASHLATAIGLNPPDFVLKTLRVEQAHLLLLTGSPEEALHACDVVLKANSGAWEVRGVRATALLKLKVFREAELEFTRYLDRGGEPTADIYWGRGQARMELGDYPGAVDDYSDALRLKPDWVGWTHRGWAHYFAKAHLLAVRDFDFALKLKSSGIEPLIGRGLARVALNQDAEAIQDAEKAFGQPPEDPHMLLNLACIFGRAASRGDPGGAYRRKAVKVLRMSLAQLPAPERKSFWIDLVLKDDHLDALKSSPEFLELGERAERGLTGDTP